MSEIRVLSVQQPHADLIILGCKWSENRTWTTNYRGELYIHASRWDVQTREAYRRDGLDPAIESALGCHTGAIIGRVQLHDVVPVEDVEACQVGRAPKRLKPLKDLLRGADKQSWLHVSGPFCWILTDPEPLAKPIPALGKLGIWRFDAPSDQLTFREFATA